MNAHRRLRSHSGIWIGLAAFALLAVPVTRTAHAQLKMEILTVETMTLRTPQILTGEPQGKPVTITGELRLPHAGTDKLPAVVLLHGSSGAGIVQDDWARELNSWGITAFILDSFSSRTIVNTRSDARNWKAWR